MSRLNVITKKSGTKVWCYVTSDNAGVLHNIARRLGVEVKFDSRGRHLDLTIRQANLALKYEGELRRIGD